MKTEQLKMIVEKQKSFIAAIPRKRYTALGLIGAWVYFIGTAGTFWLGVLGFLKGLVWPAFLVYAALKSLGL